MKLYILIAFYSLLNHSHDGHPGIKANLKAVQGDLFMLEKYIFFVSKQPTLIELSDIHQVVFSRLGAGMGATAARTFDLKIVTKSGPEYTFTSVTKEEHEVTEAYLKDKKVRVKNEMMEGELIMAGEDDEDEEMQSVASSGEEVPKPRLGGDDDDSEDGECPLRFSVNDRLIAFSQMRTSRRPNRTLAHQQTRTLNQTVDTLPLMPVAIASSPKPRKLRRRQPPKRRTQKRRRKLRQNLSRKPRRTVTRATRRWTLTNRSHVQSPSQNLSQRLRMQRTRKDRRRRSSRNLRINLLRWFLSPFSLLIFLF